MKIETANRFAVINPKNVRIFDVYVDGSFGPKHTVDSNGNSPYGSGWTLVDKYSSESPLLGCGMTQFWDTHSSNSSVGELRSVLQFFEGLAEHFPHMMKQKYKYYVNCDNANLVQLISKSQINKDAARSAKEKYGDDYTKLCRFMWKTNIEFSWIKGHAGNKFNCLADSMASKAYRAGHLNREFTGCARSQYITGLFSAYEIILPQGLKSQQESPKKPVGEEISEIKPFKKLDKWKEGKSLHVGTAFIKDGTNTYHQGVTFSMDEGKTLTSGTHLISGAGEEISKTAVQLEAFQRALFAYRTTDGVDISTPLNIFTNINSIRHVINSLSKDIFPDVSCPRLAAEIQNIRILMTGMNIRAVYVKHLLMASMTNSSLRLARQSAGKSSLYKPSDEVLTEDKELVNQ